MFHVKHFRPKLLENLTSHKTRVLIAGRGVAQIFGTIRTGRSERYEAPAYS
ncbi:MAG TPA: hypothetical protein VKE72_02180 [Methylocella sp.]|nr:hypothetical protein [Methylocella sp.]